MSVAMSFGASRPTLILTADVPAHPVPASIDRMEKDRHGALRARDFGQRGSDRVKETSKGQDSRQPPS
jgi:hypothetical protein